MSLKDMFEIPISKALCYVCFVSAALVPGTLLLSINKSELFSTLPFLSLLLLTVSISIPTLLINTAIAFQGIPDDAEKREYIGLIIGCMIDYFIWTIPLLINYLFKSSLRLTILILLVVELLIILFISLTKKYIKEGMKKSLTTNENNK